MAEEEKKKAGRHPKAEEEKKSIRITFLADENYYGLLKKAADAEHISLTAYIRNALNAHMKRGGIE